jgi:hypothetical protein
MLKKDYCLFVIIFSEIILFILFSTFKIKNIENNEKDFVVLNLEIIILIIIVKVIFKLIIKSEFDFEF